MELVAPVLGFCSEVWAPGATLLRMCKSADSAWIMIFIRFKVCSNVHAAGPWGLAAQYPLLLRELGCAPMARAWSMLSSWNRMADLSEDSLLPAMP